MSTLGRGAPDYTVSLRGNTYVAEPRTNTEPLRETSLNQLWLDINAEVTGPTVEWSRGIFTVDAPLEILAPNTANVGQGSHHTVFTPENDLDDDVWRLDPGNYYYNVLFEKMMIDGNRANEAAGRGIEHPERRTLGELKLKVFSVPAKEEFARTSGVDTEQRPPADRFGRKQLHARHPIVPFSPVGEVVAKPKNDGWCC